MRKTDSAGGQAEHQSEKLDAVRVRMSVSDDGAGLPSGFDLSTAGPLGLQLVRMFAGQVDGDLRIDSSNGTFVALTVLIGE